MHWNPYTAVNTIPKNSILSMWLVFVYFWKASTYRHESVILLILILFMKNEKPRRVRNSLESLYMHLFTTEWMHLWYHLILIFKSELKYNYKAPVFLNWQSTVFTIFFIFSNTYETYLKMFWLHPSQFEAHTISTRDKQTRTNIYPGSIVCTFFSFFGRFVKLNVKSGMFQADN